MLVFNQKSLLLVFNQNISAFSQTCLFFFSTQNLYQEKGSFLSFCLAVQREGETMLMELPDFQKSQTKRHCTWQTDYAALKLWGRDISETLGFLNMPFMNMHWTCIHEKHRSCSREWRHTMHCPSRCLEELPKIQQGAESQVFLC